MDTLKLVALLKEQGEICPRCADRVALELVSGHPNHERAHFQSVYRAACERFARRTVLENEPAEERDDRLTGESDE